MHGYELDPADDLQDQVRAILNRECTAARRELWAADAVHAVRQHGKRSRALLRLVKPGLRKKHFRRMNHAWRDIGRLLAPARDHSVINDCLTRLQKRYPELLTTGTLVMLQRQLPRITRSHMQATLCQVQVALNELCPLLRRLSCDGSWSTVITGHTHALDACRTAQRRVAEHNHATRRHEWRKRIKDVRYQTRLLRHLSPGMLTQVEKVWERMGDLLGAENDLVMTRRWIAGLPAGKRRSAIGEAAQQWLRHLRRRTDRAAERLPDTAELVTLLTCAQVRQD